MLYIYVTHAVLRQSFFLKNNYVSLSLLHVLCPRVCKLSFVMPISEKFVRKQQALEQSPIDLCLNLVALQYISKLNCSGQSFHCTDITSRRAITARQGTALSFDRGYPTELLVEQNLLFPTQSAPDQQLQIKMTFYEVLNVQMVGHFIKQYFLKSFYFPVSSTKFATKLVTKRVMKNLQITTNLAYQFYLRSTYLTFLFQAFQSRTKFL